MINADAQNLDIQFRKCRVLRFIRRNLAGSNRGISLREEDQDRRFSPVVAESDFLVQMALECKIRSQIAYFYFHIPLLLVRYHQLVTNIPAIDQFVNLHVVLFMEYLYSNPCKPDQVSRDPDWVWQ